MMSLHCPPLNANEEEADVGQCSKDQKGSCLHLLYTKLGLASPEEASHRLSWRERVSIKTPLSVFKDNAKHPYLHVYSKDVLDRNGQFHQDVHNHSSYLARMILVSLGVRGH